MRFISTLLLSSLVFVSSAVYADNHGNGMINVKSAHDVSTTIDKLQALLEQKGMTIMARVNHSKGAEKAGLSLPPTELLIFGNPKIGTPLMHCQRTVAIDLPQKALAWEDADGVVWLSYNDPQYLHQRHDLADCAAVLKKVSGALAKFTAAATQ